MIFKFRFIFVKDHIENNFFLKLSTRCKLNVTFKNLNNLNSILILFIITQSQKYIVYTVYKCPNKASAKFKTDVL